MSTSCPPRIFFPTSPSPPSPPPSLFKQGGQKNCSLSQKSGKDTMNITPWFMHVRRAYQWGKKCWFFWETCVCTKWMIPIANTCSKSIAKTLQDEHVLSYKIRRIFLKLIEDLFIPTTGSSKMSITQLLTHPAITCSNLTIKTGAGCQICSKSTIVTL